MKALRWMPFGKRIMVTFFCRLSFWLGEGYARTITYRKGKVGRAIIRNPYHREMMAATVVGSFEALERRSFSYTWEDVDGDDVIRINPAVEGTDPDLAQRLAYTPPQPKPGRRIWECCPRCGAPLGPGLPGVAEGPGGDHRLPHRLPHGLSSPACFPCGLPGAGSRAGQGHLPGYRGHAVGDSPCATSAPSSSRPAWPAPTSKETFSTARCSTLCPLSGLGNPVEYEAADGRLSVTLENPFNEYLDSRPPPRPVRAGGGEEGRCRLGAGRPLHDGHRDGGGIGGNCAGRVRRISGGSGYGGYVLRLEAGLPGLLRGRPGQGPA